MKKFLINLAISIGKSLPLINSIRKIFTDTKAKGGIDFNKLAWFGAELIGVLTLLWAINHFGITTQDIKSLFDLF